MEETNQNKGNKNEEVDFEPLIAWFLGIFSSVGNFFKWIAFAIKSQLKLMLGFLALGLICGAAVYFFAPKKYESSLNLGVKHTDNQTCFNLVRSLSWLVEDKSSGSLANLLKITEQEASQIKFLEYRDFNFRPVQARDTIVEKKSFFILVETTNPEGLPNLQEALVNYLNNQPLISEYRENLSREFEQKIARVSIELVEIDSLKKIVAGSIQSGNKGQGIVFVEPVDPVTVFKKADELHNTKIYLENELRNLKSIAVHGDFVASEKPRFPRYRHIAFVALGFLVLGLVYAMYRVRNDRFGDHTA